MSSIDAGIYGGGPLYSGGQPLMDQLRASGMTTIVAWSVHVGSDGDLVFNDPPIVQDGEYVGDADWPAQLASLKKAPTSVTRLLFSVGAGGVEDFTHIQELIQEHGTGPDSILHRNFAALKEAIPEIDGIDFDDEDLYDEDTTVAFAEMLNGIGYEVTFCPYSDMDFWTACLRRLNEGSPGLVTTFNLQCYSGGSGNAPGPWIDAIKAAMGEGFDAEGMVKPGLWCANGPDCADGDCPDSIQQTLAGWQDTGIEGGWIWLLDDVLKCESSGSCSGGPMGVDAYAAAITGGLG